MKNKMEVLLVIGFVALAGALVYWLSTTTPTPEMTNAPTSLEETAHASSPVNPREGALTPDLSKVDAYQFVDPIPLGKPAPDFSVTTAEGKPLKLSGFKGKKNVVLIFYQGSFCSVCGHQLANLQQHFRDFAAQNAEIIAISADDKAHALKTVGEYGLGFPVVPDPEQKVIERYGVSNISKGGIAWPSAFVVDTKGLVRLSYTNSNGHRLHSSELLPVLSKITGKPAPKLKYDE